MNEEATFKKLKQLPYDEMLKIYNESVEKPGIPPIMNVGTGGNIDPTTFETQGTLYTRDYRPPSLARLATQVKVLKENGWELEDFLMEVEKQSIMHEVETLNKCIKFPEILLQRAKFFFPNMKFTEAKLELE